MSLAVITQTAVIAKVPLLHGYADLPLLVLASWAVHEKAQGALWWSLMAGVFAGYTSELPWWVFLMSYGVIVLTANTLKRKLWQAPVVILFVIVATGTIVLHGASYLALVIGGTPLPFANALNLITLPSIMLNLFLALPVYGIIGEIARLLSSKEVEKV